MFLSFIVPVYNTEQYLSECLDSLLCQDLPSNDYEIICINDGSTDESANILAKYSQSSETNIKVISQSNAGVSASRNQGLNKAMGDYVWFVDSDDIIHPNILKKLKMIAESNEADRIITGFYLFNSELTKEEKSALGNATLGINSRQYDSVVTTSLFKRDFLLRNQLFFREDITHGEDTLFMYELNLYSPTVIDLEKAYYLYRKRMSSATTSSEKSIIRNKQRSYLKIAEIMKTYYDAQKGDSQTTANCLMGFLWMELLILAQLPREDTKEEMAHLKEIGLFPFKRPAACTVKRSYQTTREDIIGKIFEFVYLHMHRRWGYETMRYMNWFRLLRKNAMNSSHT